jgi:elongation factor G
MVRMHAADMEDINEAGAGDFFAFFGVDCASGDKIVMVESSNMLKSTIKTTLTVNDIIISLEENNYEPFLDAKTSTLKQNKQQEPQLVHSVSSSSMHSLMDGVKCSVKE